MMKKVIFAFFIFTLALSCFSFAFAEGPQPQTGEKIEIKFFYKSTCPLCLQAKEFLADLERQYPEVTVERFNVFERGSIESLKQLYQEYEVPRIEQGLVPVIFTKERYFVSFNQAIAQEIEGCIQNCIAGRIGGQEVKHRISLPIIGQIDPAKYSLLSLAVVLGFFDGFNVCSLGALALILGLVLVLRSRKKVLAFGGIFIITTAVIYGLLIVLWYQVFAFLAPYLRLMEILIGLLGVGGGVYFLKSFLRSKKQGPTCEVGTGKGIMARFSSRMQQTFEQGGSILVLLGGVLLFAAVITIVEFPCSAAVPVFFAGILASSKLPVFSYLLYIAIFILFYMLDEIIVFLVAVFTMTIKLASKKFVTWVMLAEAIVLFLLGAYYLFGFLIFH